MHVKLPYVNLGTSSTGRRYAYYRRDGSATAIKSPDGLPLLPGQPGFLDAYGLIHAAHGGKVIQDQPVGPDRSISALVASYLASDAFAEKAPSTQRMYSVTARGIAEKVGTKLASAIELPHVLALRDAFGGRATPRKANVAVAVLSILMEHARALGWRKDNPCLRPKKLATGPGFLSWTEDEVEQFLTAPTVAEPLKRVVATAYWTGLRGGDLVNLPRSARRGGAIVMKTSKTGAEAYVPEHPRLTAILDAAPPSISPALLTRADGERWGIDHLRHKIAEAVAEVGLRKGLTLHGLRKGLTAALAEAEATDAEIDALVPHSDPNMTRYYRKAASQKKMAASGIAKLRGGKA